MKTIYLDYNATTPIDKEVANAMKPFLDEYFGNPSSAHSLGVKTRQAVEHARKQISRLLNCYPDEIIFTSGGSESNNYAIKGVAFRSRNRGNHIITSSIEHPAVMEVCRFLESIGFEVTYLPVDKYGLVNPDDVEKSIKVNTILITIMHANNEVGTIQPVEKIAEIAKRHSVLFHTDAAQSVGKIATDVKNLGVDLLSVAGHKFYAPKGIGALFIRRGVKLQKLIHGADHEQNLRAGTENVLEIVGLGKAAEIAGRDLQKNSGHLKKMRDILHEALNKLPVEVKLNGHPEKRLPNTLSLSFKNIEANTLLSEIEGVAASAGAACHADNIDISYVLTAMKIPIEFAMGTVRFSTGKYTTKEEINRAAKIISEAVKRLKPDSESAPSETGTADEIKLTHFTHGLGCACKIRPQYLERVLEDIPVIFDKNVLIGADTSDDAAVYKINENTAIVQTVDFFTPIVDDPYHFGAIAAANSLSDIYAMGAKPLFALNIVGFPDNRLPIDVLKKILKGASDKAEEAGIPILGGHTVEDTEPKFGMVVTGIINPDKVLSNAGAKPGDVLILTKPLGTGIISTGIKRGLVDDELRDIIIGIMSELNEKAASALDKFDVNACTDITGFGLMGHLKEMVQASAVEVEIDSKNVPLIPGAADLATAGVVPGGTKNNLDYVSGVVNWADDISETTKLLLCDAQTSGGLLISLPIRFKDKLLEELQKNGVDSAKEIGWVKNVGDGKIFVV